MLYKNFKNDTAKQCRENINEILNDGNGILKELNTLGVFPASLELATFDSEKYSKYSVFRLFVFLVSVPFLFYVRYNQNTYIKKSKKKYPEFFV